MKKSLQQKNVRMNSGYALYFAIIITGLLILISYVTANISIKELSLSTTAADSHTAFYNADAGLECALYWDIKNPGGTAGLSAFDPSTPATITCNNQTLSVGGNGTGGLYATPAYIQSNSGRAGSGQESLAFLSNNTQGNMIIVGILCEVNSAISNTPSDTRGNSYSKAVSTSVSGGSGEIEIWYAPNITAGSNTVSATCNSGATILHIHEYSGLATSVSLDQTAVNSTYSTSNPATTPLVTTTVPSELLFELGIANVNGATPTSPFSQREAYVWNTYSKTGDRTVSSIGSYQSSFNNPNLYQYSVFATFKANGTGATNGSSTFQLNLTSGCAVVTVTKSGTDTTIESRGYNVCSGSRKLERAVRIVY